jgi:sporulation protein YpjB
MSVFLFSKRVLRRNGVRLTLACALCAWAFLAAAPSTAWGSLSGESRLSGKESFANSGDSASRVAYERFLFSAETLYAEVNESELEKARVSLNELERQFRGLPLKEIATADGILALAHNITELKRTAAALEPDLGKWKSASASLRIAADAMVHSDKPLWHRYQKILRDDLARVGDSLPKEATVMGPVSRAALLSFDQLKGHYDLIRTAAMLRTEPWKVERSDAVIRYALRVYRAESPTAELLLSTIPPLQEALDGLFPEDESASTALVPPIGMAPPSWGWSAMMGSFIVTILTWVGWRRYKVEELSGKGGGRGASGKIEPEDAAQRWLRKWKK